MASFDIESTVDDQSLDNAVNNLKKEILNRYDFNSSKTTLEHDKKAKILNILTDSDMKVRQIDDAFISKLMKQGIDPGALDASKEHYASGNMVRKEIYVKSGIDKETGKKIIKLIKGSKLKVQAQMMDEKLRVTGKKIDDLQKVIQMLRGEDRGIPLQFRNMK